MVADVLGYKTEECTRGVIMRGFKTGLFSEHTYSYNDKMEGDESGGICSTNGTCKMHADVLSEILNEIGLMPD